MGQTGAEKGCRKGVPKRDAEKGAECPFHRELLFSVAMGLTTRHYHKKILKLAKGFRGRQKNCYTIAVRSVIKAQRRSYDLLSIRFILGMWEES